jgi:hypothetical protein
LPPAKPTAVLLATLYTALPEALQAAVPAALLATKPIAKHTALYDKPTAGLPAVPGTLLATKITDKHTALPIAPTSGLPAAVSATLPVVCSQSCLQGSAKITFRSQFKDATRRDSKGIYFHVFGRTIDGTNPDCIFVWKVTFVHPRDHAGQIVKATNHCWKQVPTYGVGKMSVNFDRIISGISNVNPKVKKALRSYIFSGGKQP